METLNLFRWAFDCMTVGTVQAERLDEAREAIAKARRGSPEKRAAITRLKEVKASFYSGDLDCG